MSVWSAREASLNAIQSSLASEAGLVADLLDLLAVCAKRLGDVGSPLARVSAICTIKARNLATALYSLALDALAQEAGALLRPLIETLELMAYLRDDPTRVEEAMAGRLPSAGRRAKLIGGRFQKWREHLNSHSSHFAFTPESVRHLVDTSTLELRVAQESSELVLRENLKALFAVLFFCSVEAIRTLHAVAPGAADDLATRAETSRAKGTSIFTFRPSDSDPPSG